ncbi:hypothetical protein [Sphingomonas sanxanigenens]|uniref:Uncharacterized protein n=1 Tax=Sphingomonas sanxanigenens DSM 19645 = NX02 TaxID=1123269 RepID=W0A468_9SPHN|nr:hypothetical protein [Sphingomonas sanxanigenens]AHE52754.1 hypothetical protein NX02_05065 [Sphingomonas sanxanigenens DSM 19645 = NX02]
MKRLIAAALLWLFATLPVHAKAPVIDPAKAYVLVEVGNLDDAMMKGTKVPGVVTLARYDAEKGDVPGGADRIVTQGKAFGKSKTGRLYLFELAAGNWVIEGANGTAFSLGSMMFAIAPGEIVDLGVLDPAVDWAEGEAPKSVLSGMMGAMLFGSMQPKDPRPVRIDWHARGPSDLVAPPALAGRTIVPASFTPDRTFGNYLGGLVNRFGGRAARRGASTATTVSPQL